MTDNPFSAARVALAQALNSTDYPASDAVPEDLITPAIIAQAADPYIDDQDVTLEGELSLNLELWLLVELDTNEQAVADLDAMLAHVLAHLPDGWGVDGAGRPGPVNTANWIAHGMPVRVSRYITL